MDSQAPGLGIVSQPSPRLQDGIAEPKNFWRDLVDRIARGSLPSRPRYQGPNLISKLPDETLLQVLQYLDYNDLQNCQKVSKRFQILTLDRTLNKTMFRQNPGPATKVVNYNPADVHIHPILAKLDLCQNHIIDCHILDRNRRRTIIRAHQTTAWNEMATNPPMSILRFSIDRLLTESVTNKYGVRVKHLIRRICKVMDKKYRYNMTLGSVQKDLRYNLSDAQRSTRMGLERLIKNVEALPRNPTWKGFDRARKTPGKEILVLSASLRPIEAPQLP